MNEPGSPKWWSELATLLGMSWALGYLGVDRFYKGQVGWGILKLITFGAGFVWWIVDAAVFTYRFGKTGQWRQAVPATPAKS